MSAKPSHIEAARREELASFLRARRASLQPGDVDLCPAPGRRNTPGLRREEVAQISGVGVTWYTWLEQARPIPAREEVIDALAYAFRLDHEAHRHLRCLAGLPVPAPDRIPRGATPALTRMLDTLLPAPAALLGPRFDFVAWNDTFSQIWDPGALPSDRCNLMWLAFADEKHRDTWVHWENRSRTLLAEFRAVAGEHAGDARFAELIDALERTSAEFRTWWPRYEVRHSIAGRIAIRLPNGAGTVKVDVVELRPSARPLLTLSIQFPVSAADRERLTTLTKHSELN